MDTKMSSFDFTTGNVVMTCVIALHQSGISVKTVKGGVPGVIKLSCFGTTQDERVATMARYAIGQRVLAKVCAYHEAMSCLVLELASAEDQGAFWATLQKPMKRLLPEGTTLVIDSANVLGAAHCEVPKIASVDVLRSLDEGLKDLGYDSILFMEYSTYNWVIKTYPESSEAFVAFCKEKVGLVHGEADEVLLQTELTMPNAVILSNDWFRDYAEAYSEIVGTQRVCKYSVVSGAQTVISIHGVKDLIPLQTVDEDDTEGFEKMLAPEIACIEERVESPVTPRARCQKVALHDLRRKVAQHDAEAIENLATCYATGKGVRRNFHKSVVLDRVALEAKKREQEHRRRSRRGKSRRHKCCA